MKTKQWLLLLPLIAVCATPASANYFANPQLGYNLNIGSAPNPKPVPRQRVYSYDETTTVYPAPPRVAEAAPPEPEIAPPPAPPPVNQFLVFFEFDKSALTPEAREIVAMAVSEAMKRGPVRIVVTGHTDTVGSSRYNLALSERRANSVKTEMMRLGMNGAEIVTIGKGFMDPLVQTGLGVREPQNRRAVIDIDNPAVAQLAR